MPSDRKDELLVRLNEIDEKHDERLREAGHMLGRFFRAMTSNNVTQFMFERFLSKVMAFFLARRAAVPPGSDIIEIASSWLELPTFMRMEYEVEEASDDRVAIVWRECPLGFRGMQMAGTCRASTSVDVETVRRMGARLRVTETILEGAPVCRFVLTR